MAGKRIVAILLAMALIAFPCFSQGACPDLTGDGDKGLSAIIRGLRILAKISESSIPTPISDVDNDGKIGLSEVIYILQIVSELRQCYTANGYTVAGTGQTRCYNALTEVICPASGAEFYGQDAQYTRNAPSYTLGDDSNSVHDNNTGLTWMRGPNTTLATPVKADKMTYDAAQTWVTTVNNARYGGYSDWRLPTIKELYSLIKFNGTDPSGYAGTDTSGLTPFIDTTYFNFGYGQASAGERIIDSQYASSTLYVFKTAHDGSTSSVAGNSTLFGVNFADGRIKGYGLQDPQGEAKTFFMQLVRGNASYGVNHFTDNGDLTITDQATGLMWSKSDSGSGMDWQQALEYARSMNARNHLGHNDWRLPNAKELQSIVDYTRSPDTTGSAAINPIFTCTPILNEAGHADYAWYWTSTTHASYIGTGAGVYVAFGRAVGWQQEPPTASCYTLNDVHGAGAQRSDPKTTGGKVRIGNACGGGTAYGLGPQGDVQRALNHVRLIRGG